MSRTVQRMSTLPVTEPLPIFARTCQASVLIGRSLTHLREYGRVGKPRDAPINEDEATQLSDELATMCRVIKADATATSAPGSSSSPAAVATASSAAPSASSPPATQEEQQQRYLARVTALCLAYSGLLMTLDAYSCPESFKDSCVVTRELAEQEARLQMRAVEAMKVAAADVREIGRTLLLLIGGETDGMDTGLGPSQGLTNLNLSRISPLAFDSMYAAAATLHWVWNETGDLEAEAGVSVLRQCLAAVGRRWRLGNEYLHILSESAHALHK